MKVPRKGACARAEETREVLQEEEASRLRCEAEKEVKWKQEGKKEKRRAGKVSRTAEAYS